jgi:hypothetical protein
MIVKISNFTPPLNARERAQKVHQKAEPLLCSDSNRFNPPLNIEGNFERRLPELTARSLF